MMGIRASEGLICVGSISASAAMEAHMMRLALEEWVHVGFNEQCLPVPFPGLELGDLTDCLKPVPQQSDSFLPNCVT